MICAIDKQGNINVDSCTVSLDNNDAPNFTGLLNGPQDLIINGGYAYITNNAYNSNGYNAITICPINDNTTALADNACSNFEIPSVGSDGNFQGMLIYR